MRYIKPPKKMSRLFWGIGKPIPGTQEVEDYGPKDHFSNVAEYIATEGTKEYILDSRIFRSALITELLNLKISKEG